MKNEVFTKAAEAVEAFQKDYQERLEAAEKQLAQLEEKQAQAEARAEAAVAADDQTAWRKADKDRTDAASGIKFTQERLAMIRSGAAYPLRDYEDLLEKIEAEQGRATLAFVASIQNIYRKALQEYEKLEEVLKEGREALGILYAAGDGPDAGYRVIEDYQPNWGYQLRHGTLFDGLLEVETHSPNTDPIIRAMKRARAAIQKEEGKA